LVIPPVYYNRIHAAVICQTQCLRGTFQNGPRFSPVVVFCRRFSPIFESFFENLTGSLISFFVRFVTSLTLTCYAVKRRNLPLIFDNFRKFDRPVGSLISSFALSLLPPYFFRRSTASQPALFRPSSSNSRPHIFFLPVIGIMNAEAAAAAAAIQLQITRAVAAAMAAHVAAPAAAVPVVPVAHFAVKLPTFWTTDPDMWFFQAECSFNRSRITTSYTKFEHVVTRLPEEVMISVRCLLQEMTPTTEDAYEQLKEALTTSYGRTRWQRGFAIIDHPDLGDRRPSRMMSEMLALLPTGTAPDLLFLCLFLRRLPASMRDHLAAADHKTTAAMAAHADLLWDSRAGQSVASIAESVAAVAARRAAAPTTGTASSAAPRRAAVPTAGLEMRIRASVSTTTSSNTRR
jgi:hypothetical protein